jgi:hypothetical protein
LDDFKAELEQLAVDARRSPQRIVNAHPSDQRAQVGVDLRPTSDGASFPTPVPAEACPMPAHKGLGLFEVPLRLFDLNENKEYASFNKGATCEVLGAWPRLTPK